MVLRCLCRVRPPRQEPAQPAGAEAAEDSDADAQAVVHHFASGDAVAPAMSVDYGGGAATGTRAAAGGASAALNGHPAASAAAPDAFTTPAPGQRADPLACRQVECCVSLHDMLVSATRCCLVAAARVCNSVNRSA